MPKKVQSFMRKKYLKKEFYWDGSVTTGSLRDSSKDIHAAVSVGALLAFNTGQQLAPPPKHKEILHGNSVIEPTLTAREEHSDDDFAEFISAFPSTPSTSKASQSTAPVKDKVDPYSDLFGLNWSTPVPASQEISIPQAVPEMHTPGLQSQETLLSCSADVAQTVTYDLVVTKNVAMPNMDDSSILSPPPANEPVTTVKKESDYDALRAMMEEDTVSALSSFEDVEVSIETPCFETLVNVAPSVDPFPVIDSLLDEEPSIQTNEHSSVEKEFSKSTLVDQLSTLSLGSDSAVKKGAVALSGVETASNPWDFPDKQAQTQFQFSFDNVWS